MRKQPRRYREIRLVVNGHVQQPWGVIDSTDGSVVGTYATRSEARQAAILLNRNHTNQLVEAICTDRTPASI